MTGESFEGVASEEAMTLYHRHIWNIAFQMTGDADDADDVAQEAFVRVCRSVREFRGDASFSTWLYRITVNLSCDVLRRRRRQRCASLDEMEARGRGPALSGGPPGDRATIPCSGDDIPDHQAVAGELRVKLREAIMSLPDHHRAAVILRDIEGLSYREIAQALSCPEGTVMSRLHYARTTLRGMLGPYLEG